MGSGFVYFVEGVGTSEAATIARTLDVFDGVEVAACGVLKGPGPDQSGGVVFAAKGTDRIGFYPREQTWSRHHASRFMFGWNTASPPGPADLIRPGALPGIAVELGDGRVWEVPRAVVVGSPDPVAPDAAIPRTSVVPRHQILDDGGNWTPGAVTGRYVKLFEAAEYWWDHVGEVVFMPGENGDATATIDDDELRDRAVDVLASSFRVGRDEVAALGLLTDQTVLRILSAAVDLDSILQYVADLAQKKTDSDAPDTSGSSRGGPERSRTTDRRSPTSSL